MQNWPHLKECGNNFSACPSLFNIESLINQGRYFEARTKAEEALKHSSELRYKQLLALAISKLGTPEAALDLMEPIYRQFPDDPESAGILGSIFLGVVKKNQSTAFCHQIARYLLPKISRPQKTIIQALTLLPCQPWLARQAVAEK